MYNSLFLESIFCFYEYSYFKSKLLRRVTNIFKISHFNINDMLEYDLSKAAACS